MTTKIISGLLLCCFCMVAKTQPIRMTGPEKPLDSLNDEFTDATFLTRWQQWNTTEGQPDKWKALRVENDVLHLQPYASGWYGDFKAPLMYKMVEGNFDVRTKIKVTGLNSALPQTEWSLAGLMVRQPVKAGAAWEPRQENWLFLTTGIAEPKGSPVLEAKSTNNSVSNLKLRPAREGWVELRIVRIQASFILMYRYEGDEWKVVDRFYRPLMPFQLQVGINAYSGWNALPADMKANPALHNASVLKDISIDMAVQADYLRFVRPTLNREKLNAFIKPGFQAPYYTPGNLLTDYSISDDDLLQILDTKPSVAIKAN